MLRLYHNWLTVERCLQFHKITKAVQKYSHLLVGEFIVIEKTHQVVRKVYVDLAVRNINYYGEWRDLARIKFDRDKKAVQLPRGRYSYETKVKGNHMAV